MNFKSKITKLHYDKNAKGLFFGFLKLCSIFYGLGSGFKNLLYDKRILKPEKVNAYVISVGNLTTGGVGKTPVVSKLAKYFIQKAEKVAIISRGYGGKLSNKQINVISDGKDIFCNARLAGDEPFWLAENTKGAVVITSKNRVEAAKYAVKKYDAAKIILDDGFQHRKLYRDLDFVLMDSEKGFGNEKLLPAGPLREGTEAFKRIDKLIIVSKNTDHTRAEKLSKIMSTLGLKQYATDSRNTLFYYAMNAIDELQPDFVLFENVPKFLQLKYIDGGDTLNVVEILNKHYGEQYYVESQILNAMYYGVPQSRPRAIIKMYKKNKLWPWPKKEPIITLRQAIGSLPSLESGEDSGIKWHKALVHSPMQIEALKHTPEGKSALTNSVYYPKKKNGERVKGFHNTYKRMKWDEPAPARTTNSALISGHNNVHPGRQLPDGMWSDARVLTLRELIIVSSLPLDWNIPQGYKESFVRELIGEAIPPMLCKKIVEQVTINN